MHTGYPWRSLGGMFVRILEDYCDSFLVELALQLKIWMF
jgi:hypothetical protein